MTEKVARTASALSWPAKERAIFAQATGTPPQSRSREALGGSDSGIENERWWRERKTERYSR